ncbi:type 4b pilus protein PilO2 [Herbaspirillum sp. ST 5-3]|uniref:type 4b pilus protein PilO2 n=1 Tax=Oxalobacteraceae TaxID=75682 RepID=UPI0010A31368|nr:type 4b pilus protein PilO2 [Herbaspirillum sp. ST 5-3]
MATHITQIGKHKFVCGLFWQSLSRPRELAKEAATLARKIDSDLMVLRKDHATAQAGFAHTRDGARRNMYSLAAAVSKTLAIEGANYDGEKQPVHSWLGAFKLPEGVWAYFAVRDANFLPTGDFVGTKDEVVERLLSDYGMGGWNIVIGDEELEDHGFHNFNAKRIEELLPRKRNGQIRTHSWWRLRQTETAIPWVPLIAAGCVLALSGGGAAYWYKEHKRKEAEERERAIEAARAKLFGNKQAQKLPSPWAAKPLPMAFVQACLQKFGHLTAGGWSLDEYACTPAQVSYTWSRQDSTIAFLLEQIPKANVDLTGQKAIYSEPLTLAAGKEEPILTSKELIEPLVSRLQLLDIAPKLGKRPPPPPPPGNAQDPKPNTVIVPEWQTYSIAMNSGALPLVDVAEILSKPGVRLEKLVYKSGAWSIEGVMYAK